MLVTVRILKTLFLKESVSFLSQLVHCVITRRENICINAPEAGKYNANKANTYPQPSLILWWRCVSPRRWWEAHISSSSAACLPICASHPSVPCGLRLCAMKPSHLPTWATWKIPQFLLRWANSVFMDWCCDLCRLRDTSVHPFKCWIRGFTIKADTLTVVIDKVIFNSSKKNG